ncbi:restriction endonuclease subunit S [Flammeovirga kamogawensis]|uniref:Restriction endonuclease subunit S n=1 Tax=Flammeovirga kamogawensis TaxID=373891 RepID=A0ABX8H135_9BACT|nr:restriction endonuclease subunit S [Flammeovirga kamogawensis]MBB6462266.1 type I restriction enzyme S subunit [Flammeovirga kamogawensis]QWG09338.1 restriction endonuclease subunit S [Flammeovirga kamogawensis]TRX64860.1 hypothetical protein EO216_20200 [Flammeovirga kamogawensis]
MVSEKVKNIIRQVRGVSFKGDASIDTFEEGYIPILRSNNIGEGTINFDNLIYIKNDLVKEDQKLKKGDILITASTGSLNVIGKNGSFNNDYDGSFGAFCKVVRPLEDKVYPQYLKYFFQSSYYRTTIKSVINGANINNIKNEHIDDLKIPLRPLPEQKRIASLLDAADRNRRLNQELIKEYNRLTQSIFLEMFGDPVSNPMGWEKVKLGDFIEIKHGFAFKSENFVKDSDFKLLTPGHFFENGGFKDIGVKQKFYDGEFPSEYLLGKGDLLVAMTEQAYGLLGSTLLVPEEKTFLHNQRLGLIDFDSNVLNKIFVYYLFNQKSIRSQIQMSATGTKVRHTSPKKIYEVEFSIPSFDLQNQFANRITLIEDQKRLAEESLAASEDLFNALLQEVFAK